MKWNMILKKNQILTATLLVALCGAVFVNWYYSRPENKEVGNLGEAEYVNATVVSTTKKNTTSEYFASSKLRRENAHKMAKETLNAVITNKDSSKEAVENATVELSELASLIKKEGDLENIISAKLSTDCVVILGDNKVEVIVSNSVLKDSSISIIRSSVIEQTNMPENSISIIGAK